MQRQRNILRVLFSIMAAQIAAMSIMIGAAALVVERPSAQAEASAELTAGSEPARAKCERRSALDLIVF